MNSNSRTVVNIQFHNGKMRWVPVDDMMDKGIPISDTLEIVWNKKRDDLSINTIDGNACVFHFEVHDGKLECVYFDSSQLE